MRPGFSDGTSESRGIVFETVRLLAIVTVLVAACVTGMATLVGQGQAVAQEVSLSHYGLSITLPAAWHGRVYRRPGGLPILHAGNFTLPRGDDDVGTNAIKRMKRASIFIVLLESDNPRAFHYRRLVGPPQVRERDFLPSFEGVPPNHAFARVTFTTHGRYFDLWVQFGVRPASARFLREANRVLATLRVSAS
jgi:hypothetical protein